STSRSRKPPLRTYSRRSAPPKASDDEPPSIDREPRAAAPDPGPEVSPGQPPVLPQQKPVKHSNRPGRGSILAYFKPEPPSSDKAQSDVASSDPIDPPPTSSSSLPVPSQSRKRRRLTTRPRLSGLDQDSKDGGGGGTGPDDDSGEESRVKRAKSPVRDKTSYSNCAPRPPLSEVAANTVDLQEGSRRALTDGATKTKKQPAKRLAKDMTQTTLSLSIHKEPVFTICGVCDILYNPLNEKDRREHSRRHAAWSRKRRR
ncbi:hypothetical protein N658DRAFT_395205, partial [Parathielavia hyrcaniae]